MTNTTVVSLPQEFSSPNIVYERRRIAKAPAGDRTDVLNIRLRKLQTLSDRGPHGGGWTYQREDHSEYLGGKVVQHDAVATGSAPWSEQWTLSIGPQRRNLTRMLRKSALPPPPPPSPSAPSSPPPPPAGCRILKLATSWPRGTYQRVTPATGVR
jgi:hypothetical protein